jgi:hypothetical protein
VADIPGKYIHEKTSAQYIELKTDGSYFLFDGSAGITGNYEVNDSQITIFIGDARSQGTIQDGIIIDDEGEKWLRTGAEGVDGTVLNNQRAAYRPQPTRRAPKATDDPLVSMTWLPAIVRRDDFPWELIEAAIGIVLIIALFAATFGHRG